MILSFVKPFWILIVFPALRALIAILETKRISNYFLPELIGLFVLVFFAELRRRKMSIGIFEGEISFFDGFYLRNRSVVKKSRITAVYIKQNPIERLLGAKTVYISTESGRKNRFDFKITLKNRDADKVADFIGCKNNLFGKNYSVLSIALWAAAGSSVFSGALIVAPMLYRILGQLGEGVYTVFFAGIADKESYFDKYMPNTINTVIAVLLAVYIVAFVYQFLKNLRFRLIFSDGGLDIRSGVIVKRQSLVRASAIRVVSTEQGLIMRIFRRLTVRAVTGGYMGRYTGNAVAVPCAVVTDADFVITALLPQDEDDKICVKKVRTRLGRISALLFLITIFLIFSIVLTLISYNLKEYRRLAAIAVISIALVLAVYGDILIYSYRKSRIHGARLLKIIGSTRLKRESLFLDIKFIGMVRLRQNPFDRRRGSCKASISAFSKNSQAVTVRWIGKSSLLNIFFKKKE